jgi:hypothetical protein
MYLGKLFGHFWQRWWSEYLGKILPKQVVILGHELTENNVRK